MADRKRCLMLGAGGMAGHWIRRFLPNFRDRIEIVALVDVNGSVLHEAGDYLDLPHNRRFTTMESAFETIDADVCIIVIPPAFHKQAVLNAVARRLPILSEKPIADTWDSSVEIYRAVTSANLKMQVVQNYRYNVPMLTMRSVLRGGELGQINYVVARFSADYREYAAWGVFRHEIPHALLVEGAVHHFDMLRNLTQSDCETVSGCEWNPPWSSSKGEFCALYLLEMTNGTRALYEGSGTATGTQNPWHEEYYRAECEHGAVAVGRDHVVRIYRHRRGRGMLIEEVPPERPNFEGHNYLINEFLEWLDGGPEPATTTDDNIRTTAIVFAAIEASRTRQVINAGSWLRGLARARP